MRNYDPKKIEQKWQKYWEKSETFKTPAKAVRSDKYYILPQLPYPSGSGLHVGHAEGYTACDIFARYKRMRGKKVLQVIGWDSFGLPAENYAIKTNVHPRISTDKAVDTFRAQIKALGISVDWDREVGSHNPDYYKWTQWFFLLFYKRGLAYRKKQAVNWCGSCKTVLANEQVTNAGKCERCDTVVAQREMEQWYIKITDYADRLIKDLDKVDWPVETIKRQRDWIGRSEGADVSFDVVSVQNVENDKVEQAKRPNKRSDKTSEAMDQFHQARQSITVFTTRPDTLFGATYMVLAPEGDLVQKLKDKITNWKEVEQYINETKLKTELDRQMDREKTGVELKGVKAINPVNGKEIPVWTADYVIATYGTGAIMCVPAHDERDWEFAKKFNLPIIPVVKPAEETEGVFTGEGVANNSEFLDGLPTKEAIAKMNGWLEENYLGKRKIQYKLRDWSVSRQRFWGAPIPMLYDEKNGLHPVPEEDLPVLLPNDVDFKPTGESPLNYSKSFNKGVEKKYGQGWKREPDTLDTFMCSSWYYFRYLDPKNDKAFASPEALKTWMPVDFYIGGPEHVNGHLLYSRFFTKVLFDAGLIDFDEPFLLHRHQGLILGEDNRKMSKRWNNVINPTDVIEEYGADTTRAYEMFMGPLEADKPWDTNGVRGVRRFLERVWFLADKIGDKTPSSEKITRLIHQTVKKVTEDVEALRFNTAIAKMMELLNELSKEEEVSKSDYEKLILLLSPFAPHMCEELWQALGHKENLAFEPWPVFDPALALNKEITLAVQVNGKLRDTLTVPADISEESAKKLALQSEKIQKWLDGKEPKKIIYVTGKLVSIVT